MNSSCILKSETLLDLCVCWGQAASHLRVDDLLVVLSSYRAQAYPHGIHAVRVFSTHCRESKAEAVV